MTAILYGTLAACIILLPFLIMAFRQTDRDAHRAKINLDEYEKKIGGNDE